MAQIDEVIPVMTIKEQLLKEIELVPENLLPEILNFLLFLKTKQDTEPTTQTPSQENSTSTEASLESYRPASGRSILRHAGTWAGDDFQECLQMVYDTRGKAKFDCDNPFE